MMLGLWEPILVLLITVVSVLLGILVYFKNPKKRVNQYFTLLTFSLLIWIVSAFISELPKDLKYSLFLSRLTYLGVLLFATFLFLFSFYFPKEKAFIKGIVRYLFYGVIIVFSFLTLFTNSIIKGVISTPWGFDLVFGNLSCPYLLFCIVLAFAAFRNFFQSFKVVSGIEKLQLQYLFLGLIIFIGTSIIVNVVIRTIVGSDIYYRIGNYSAIFLIIFLAAAIIRYHLFGIEVILTEILVGVIGILLILQIFTAQTFLWKIINGILFVLFCIFGYLLIRGVFREIERRKELEKLSLAKSEFIAIASHQLRTPLTAIKGYLSMIFEGDYGEVPQKIKEKIKKVLEATERLIRLVNTILDVSKIETGEMEMKLEKVNLRETIKEAIEDLKIKAKEKNLYLKFEEPKEKIESLLDKEKIRQAILNLIDNAIKYTQEGGVTIKLETQNSKNPKIRITIKDTGEGLTEKEKEKIFERFSRGEAGAKFWVEGAGLGLFIAKNFVQMHKGKIWVESEGKGNGSIFYIELPGK